MKHTGTCKLQAGSYNVKRCNSVMATHINLPILILVNANHGNAEDSAEVKSMTPERQWWHIRNQYNGDMEAAVYEPERSTLWWQVEARVSAFEEEGGPGQFVRHSITITHMSLIVYFRCQQKCEFPALTWDFPTNSNHHVVCKCQRHTTQQIIEDWSKNTMQEQQDAKNAPSPWWPPVLQQVRALLAKMTCSEKMNRCTWQLPQWVIEHFLWPQRVIEQFVVINRTL